MLVAQQKNLSLFGKTIKAHAPYSCVNEIPAWGIWSLNLSKVPK